MVSNDILLVSLLQKLTVSELVFWLNDTATLQENHPFHGVTMPEWVPAWSRFRAHAVALAQAAKAVVYQESEQARLLDEEHSAALVSINENACYLVMRAHYENDESLLRNVGYEIREKGKRSHTSAITVSRLPLKVSLRRGDSERAVVINVERDPGAALYQVQICQGEPTGEDSWAEAVNSLISRIVIDDLEQSTWYYFRVRSLGHNESSPWSIPMGIISV